MKRRAYGFIQLALLSLVALTLATNAAAQDGNLAPPPLPVDPTPLAHLLNNEERAKLADKKNPKKQVEAYLEIADWHIDLALEAIKRDDYHAAERELDIYNKALDESAKIAFSQQNERRSMAKKIEQRIYKQIKVLESIERLFPAERLAFAERAMIRAKQLRVQALNETFDSGEVLADPAREKKKGEPPDDNDLMSAVLKSSRTLSFAASPPRPAAQIPGDYLNEQEDDQVRLAQQPDDRVKVFMKIADRRLAALTGQPVQPADKNSQKKAEQEEREWGPLPKGERSLMLRHYARAIEEVMVKLEDAYERNPKSSALPRALTALRDATERHLQVLRSLQAEMKTRAELDALKEALTEAEAAYQGAQNGLKK